MNEIDWTQVGEAVVQGVNNTITGLGILLLIVGMIYGLKWLYVRGWKLESIKPSQKTPSAFREYLITLKLSSYKPGYVKQFVGGKHASWHEYPSGKKPGLMMVNRLQRFVVEYELKQQWDGKD